MSVCKSNVHETVINKMLTVASVEKVTFQIGQVLVKSRSRRTISQKTCCLPDDDAFLSRRRMKRIKGKIMKTVRGLEERTCVQCAVLLKSSSLKNSDVKEMHRVSIDVDVNLIVG